MLAAVRQCGVMVLTLPSERQDMRTITQKYNAVQREIAFVQQSQMGSLFSYYIGFLISQLTLGFLCRSNLNYLLRQESQLNGKRVQAYQQLESLAKTRGIRLMAVAAVGVCAHQFFGGNYDKVPLSLEERVIDVKQMSLPVISIFEALPGMIVASGVVSYLCGLNLKTMGAYVKARTKAIEAGDRSFKSIVESFALVEARMIKESDAKSL